MHTFSMKIKMMDLWMQIEGTNLIFIMNFSVLDFFKFASRMPEIAEIKLVSTFKIFWGGGGGGEGGGGRGHAASDENVLHSYKQNTN